METVGAPYQALTTALTSCNDLTITCLLTILPLTAVYSAKEWTDNITNPVQYIVHCNGWSQYYGH